jgi:hypothetical protein
VPALHDVARSERRMTRQAAIESELHTEIVLPDQSSFEDGPMAA